MFSSCNKCLKLISMWAGKVWQVTDALKRISVRYSGDAYSFQCGMQSLIWGEWNIITLVVGWVGECCSEPSIELLFLSQTAKILSRVLLKHFGDACSFQFGMQLPTWGEKWPYYGGLSRWMLKWAWYSNYYS